MGRNLTSISLTIFYSVILTENKSDALYNAKRAKELGYDPAACDWLQLKINGEMHE